MPRKMSYWIKERFNPQFDKPYYVLCGTLSKRAAKLKENTKYGVNVMYEYLTPEEYKAAIIKLETDKCDVR
jgi:hypothetical protein